MKFKKKDFSKYKKEQETAGTTVLLKASYELNLTLNYLLVTNYILYSYTLALHFECKYYIITII